MITSIPFTIKIVLHEEGVDFDKHFLILIIRTLLFSIPGWTHFFHKYLGSKLLRWIFFTL